MVTIIIPIQCHGRNERREEILAKPVSVKVTVSSNDEKNILLNVNCVYNTGGHGQRCKASHPPGVDKVGEGVGCAYAVDIPYAFDRR